MDDERALSALALDTLSLFMSLPNGCWLRCGEVNACGAFVVCPVSGIRPAGCPTWG